MAAGGGWTWPGWRSPNWSPTPSSTAAVSSASGPTPSPSLFASRSRTGAGGPRTAPPPTGSPGGPGPADPRGHRRSLGRGGRQRWPGRQDRVVRDRLLTVIRPPGQPPATCEPCDTDAAGSRWTGRRRLERHVGRAVVRQRPATRHPERVTARRCLQLLRPVRRGSSQGIVHPAAANSQPGLELSGVRPQRRSRRGRAWTRWRACGGRRLLNRADGGPDDADSSRSCSRDGFSRCCGPDAGRAAPRGTPCRCGSAGRSGTSCRSSCCALATARSWRWTSTSSSSPTTCRW